MAHRHPENTKRKNFNFPPDILEMLAELAELENTSETRLVQNAIRAYYLGKKMEKSISSMTRFDDRSFAKVLSEVFVEDLKKEGLLIPADSLKVPVSDPENDPEKR